MEVLGSNPIEVRRFFIFTSKIDAYVGFELMKRNGCWEPNGLAKKVAKDTKNGTETRFG